MPSSGCRSPVWSSRRCGGPGTSDLFARLAQTQHADTVLATNTCLDMAIAAGIPDPARVIGLHFFNPPPVMRLVEVVRGAESGPEFVDDATALMRAWGKTPVRCTSTPGFIVNRVARPFYGEAQRMLMAGVADAATLDAALRSAGFRMGPLEPHRLHRPGRQPRRRHQRVGADGPRSSLRAHRAPAGASSPPVTSVPQERARRLPLRGRWHSRRGRAGRVPPRRAC